jgi:hypothetical protein
MEGRMKPDIPPVFRIRLNADPDPDPGFATTQEQNFFSSLFSLPVCKFQYNFNLNMYGIQS